MAFTSKDDINILQPSDSAVVGAGSGSDVYVLALDRLSIGQQMQISDAQGNNTLQLIGGLTISRDALKKSAFHRRRPKRAASIRHERFAE